MITRAISNCISNTRVKGWDKTYWAFDIHGTILKPTFQSSVLSTEFYPYAEEVLQLISRQSNIVRILYTCSYPDEIAGYLRFFEAHGIHFDYVNENPEISAGAYGHYDRKFYFNVLFEDKSGFDPLTDWKEVYHLLMSLKFASNLFTSPANPLSLLQGASKPAGEGERDSTISRGGSI